MNKKAILIILMVPCTTVHAYYGGGKNLIPYSEAVANVLGSKSDQPATRWWIHWVGKGELTDLAVSNTCQGGIFPQPPGCEYFDGTWECIWLSLDYMDIWGYGLNAEHPTGSRQFYTWAAGVWVGALYPVVEGQDTIWQKRVSKSAYYSDLGGMSVPEMANAGEVGDISGIGLYFSDQIIPYESGFPHEGEFLFVQPFESPKPYQVLWPFADTLLNSRRPSQFQLNPDSGNVVSNQDTYAVAGDWMPEDSAAVIWIRDAGPYDLWGLGIRIEQRTYSWDMPENEAYIYINYKIKNMNDFPLKEVYTGYFMDNDVGCGIVEAGQGAEDDCINYDTTLNLGYTYDSDGYEPGWFTSAGYMGCVMLETPGDLGLTGFQTWQRNTFIGDLIDSDGQDSLKYDILATRVFPDTFMAFTAPRDQRQLSTSGPYEELGSGEEVSFSVAIVLGLTLDELRDRTANAIRQFENGYLPSAPIIGKIETHPTQIQPGDTVAITAWAFDYDGIQSVYAEVESPDENLIGYIELYDDGFHNDSTAGDHIFGNEWVTPSVGKTCLVDIIAVDSLSNTSMIDNGAVFTSVGPVTLQDWYIIGEDTMPSQGERVNLSVTIHNEGDYSIDAVRVRLTSEDIYARIDTAAKYLGTISPGDTVTCEPFWIKISEITPHQYIVDVYLTTTDAYSAQWSDTFSIEVTDDAGPFLHSPEVTPRELQPGEEVIINAELMDGSGILSSTATIESPVGVPVDQIAMYDDGAHWDSLSGDRIFGNRWTTPEGERFYNVKISSEDSLNNLKEYPTILEFTTKEFAKTSNILVVDDDNYNRPPVGVPKFYETYYTDALDANGYQYDVWDVFCYRSPPETVLMEYDVVIWLTGTTSNTFSWEPEYLNSITLTEEERRSIRHYLRSEWGGKLFLCGQGIYDVKDDPYFTYVLGLDSLDYMTTIDTIVGIEGKPIGDGLTLLPQGGSGANNQYMQSILTPRSFPIVHSVFHYQSGGTAMFCVGAGGFDRAWVISGFGFEAISSEVMRNTLMQRIVEWLFSPTAVEEKFVTPEYPNRCILYQNYPNPFTAETEVSFFLPANSKVKLSVYNCIGERTVTLVNSRMGPGYHKVRWEGRDGMNNRVPNGIYFLRLEVENLSGVTTLTRKMLILR